MLSHLTVKNVILIDHLEINFSTGLNVLTGETGAGKSILLDAMGLALGERANSALVRPNSDKALVTAVFELGEEHPVHSMLQENDFSPSSELVLRRSLTKEGKSKAFINDTPVSIQFLKSIATELIEIHGQFDQLLSPETHLKALDAFGQYENVQKKTESAYHSYNQAKEAFDAAQGRSKAAQENEEFLRYAVEELERLSPQKGEEEKLKADRDYLMNKAKIMDVIVDVHQTLHHDGGVQDMLNRILSSLEKSMHYAPSQLEPIVQSLESATNEIVEVENALQDFLGDDNGELSSLEEVDNRLFELRAVARKHGVSVDALSNLLQQFKADLGLVSQTSDELGQLEKDLENARQKYIGVAEQLRKQRIQKSTKMGQKIESELQPLKLDKVKFKAEIIPLPEERWSAKGMDKVEFAVQTNPGLPFGSIAKIASGGERSRLMLALKVVLAQTSYSSIMIFDEIDSGVGGAVASSIGERMALLGQSRQVLSITHSPQVASCAQAHWFVEKNQSKASTTSVKKLDDQQRCEEISRMLSGNEITNEARAAAKSLLMKKQAI